MGVSRLFYGGLSWPIHTSTPFPRISLYFLVFSSHFLAFSSYFPLITSYFLVFSLYFLVFSSVFCHSPRLLGRVTASVHILPSKKASFCLAWVLEASRGLSWEGWDASRSYFPRISLHFLAFPRIFLVFPRIFIVLPRYSARTSCFATSPLRNFIVFPRSFLL